MSNGPLHPHLRLLALACCGCFTLFALLFFEYRERTLSSTLLSCFFVENLLAHPHFLQNSLLLNLLFKPTFLGPEAFLTAHLNTRLHILRSRFLRPFHPHHLQKIILSDESNLIFKDFLNFLILTHST